MSDENKKEKPSEPEVVAEDTAAFVDDWDAAFGSDNDVPILLLNKEPKAEKPKIDEHKVEAPKTEVKLLAHEVKHVEE